MFGLNVMAFLLMGLQVRGILSQSETPWNSYALALSVLGCCIVVRLAWVMFYNTVLRWVRRKQGASAAVMRELRPATGVVLAWAGMRGIVTLGAALALPADFPHRDLIQFVAFAVVLGTLGFQGLTLRPLIEWLPMPPDTREDEGAMAREEAAKAALRSLGDERDTRAGQVLAQQYERRLAEHGQAIEATTLMRLQRQVLGAEREAIDGLHRDGKINDEVFHEMEEELDWAEAALTRRDA